MNLKIEQISFLLHPLELFSSTKKIVFKAKIIRFNIVLWQVIKANNGGGLL